MSSVVESPSPVSPVMENSQQSPFMAPLVAGRPGALDKPGFLRRVENTIVAINRCNYISYSKYLPEWLRLLDFPENTDSNYQYVVTIGPEGIRDRLAAHLHSNQILARKYFYPGVHRLKAYAHMNCTLSGTEDLASRVLCLPTGQEVDEKLVRQICDVIREFT